MIVHLSVTLEARSGRSSGAAKAAKEALVRSDDPGNRRRVGVRIPYVPLKRSAEEDPVAPREHVAEAALNRISHLRLRLEDRQLPADRMKLLVSEEIARTEAGAVEDQRF